MIRVLIALILLLLAAPAAAQPVIFDRTSGSITTLGADCNTTGACVFLGAQRTSNGTIAISGTWTGTVTFEGSLGDMSVTATRLGTTAWFALSVTPQGGTSFTTTATAVGQWIVPMALTGLRVRGSAAITGTANVALLVTSARGGGGGGGGGSGTPGGSNTQCQFNDNSVFGGDAGCTYDKTLDTLTVGALTTSGSPSNSTFTGTINYCADAGASDTYACDISPAPSAYTTGAVYSFKANTANTGAATINFNSLGATTIKKATGGITTDLSDNDIRAGAPVIVQYDGANMLLQSAPGTGGTWPRVKVKNGSNQSINDVTVTVLTFDTDVFQDNPSSGQHSTSSATSRLVATAAGTYLVSCNVTYAGSLSSTRAFSELRLNANGAAGGGTFVDRAGNIATVEVAAVSSVVKMALNDYVECFSFQSSGGAQSTDAAVARFSMTQVSN